MQWTKTMKTQTSSCVIMSVNVKRTPEVSKLKLLLCYFFHAKVPAFLTTAAVLQLPQAHPRIVLTAQLIIPRSFPEKSSPTRRKLSGTECLCSSRGSAGNTDSPPLPAAVSEHRRGLVVRKHASPCMTASPSSLHWWSKYFWSPTSDF